MLPLKNRSDKGISGDMNEANIGFRRALMPSYLGIILQRQHF